MSTSEDVAQAAYEKLANDPRAAASVKAWARSIMTVMFPASPQAGGGGGVAPVIQAVTISGAQGYNGTLTANPTITGNPTSVTYTWKVGASTVGSGQNYVVSLTNSLNPDTLTCTVVASNSSGSSTLTSSGVQCTPWLYSSTINTALPSNVAVHPDSHAMIQGNANIVSTSPANWFTPAIRTAWVGPQAFSSLPQTTWNLNFTAAGGESCQIGGTQANVPWPTWMTNYWVAGSPANYTQSDSIATIFDGSGNTWGSYRTSTPGWAPRDIPNSGNCAAGTNTYNAVVMEEFATAMTSVGYNANWAYASASCIAAGLVTPEDMNYMGANGVIPHALTFAAEIQTGAGDVHPVQVSPAQAPGNNGVQSGTEAWPTGARMGLNCSFATINSWPSLTALSGTTSSGLQGASMLFARTMAEFGAIYVDGTGAGAAGLWCGYSTTPGSGSFPWESGGNWNYYTAFVPTDLINAHGFVVDWTKYT